MTVPGPSSEEDLVGRIVPACICPGSAECRTPVIRPEAADAGTVRPVRPSCLAPTPRAEVGRSRRERRSNLRGAFVAEPRLVRGRRVLVVDDVITTGATASAMVDELRRCGAVAVGIAALASASG